MSRYEGIYTFDTDSHRFVPIGNAEGVIDCFKFDHEPKEPLIKDKEYRKRIKQLAKLLGVEPDDSVWVDTSDSNIKLEFRISFMCTYYLKFCAYTTDLCIKTDYYTLAELCGEEEEPEDDDDEEDLRAEEY